MWKSPNYNKIVRTISTNTYNRHTQPTVNELKLLKVEDIFYKNDLFQIQKLFTVTLLTITTSAAQSIYP